MHTSESAATACRCRTVGPSAGRVTVRRIGIDETEGRRGEVSIWTCRACSARWLRYAARYGAGPTGEKTYIGLIPDSIDLVHAGAAEAVMDIASPVFARTGDPTSSNWAPMSRQVRLGVRS